MRAKLRIRFKKMFVWLLRFRVARSLWLYFRPAPRRFKLEMAGVIFLIPLVLLLLIFIFNQPDYQLSQSAALLVGQPDTTILNQLKYSPKTGNYSLNKKGEVQAASVGSTVSLGSSNSNAGYSAVIPSSLKNGITFNDHATGLSFTMSPLISTAKAKDISNHFIYPAANGVQAVYTIKDDGIEEDLILNHNIGNQLSYAYKLKLPSYLVAKQQSDGAIGIYSASKALFGNISYANAASETQVMNARLKGQKNNLVFELLPPVVNQSNGKQGGVGSIASARLTLKGNLVKVAAKGLADLRYPVSIDPSVLVTSAYVPGNNQGDITLTPSGIAEAGLTGGTLSGGFSYTSNGTNNGSTYSAGFTTPRSNFAEVTYGGYLYILGGQSGTSSGSCTSGSGPYYCGDVQYAPQNIYITIVKSRRYPA